MNEVKVYPRGRLDVLGMFAHYFQLSTHTYTHNTYPPDASFDDATETDGGRVGDVAEAGVVLAVVVTTTLVMLVWSSSSQARQDPY